MAKRKTIDCPGCGHSQPYRGPGTEYRCPACNGGFDDTPEEGGSYYNDPTKRIEREDEQRYFRQKRLGLTK